MNIKTTAALLGAAILATGCTADSLATAPRPTVTVTVTETATAKPDTPKATASTRPTPTRRAVTITDGTWTVGEDIPAGRYKVTEAIVGDCYWGITRSGTNGDDIIANDIVKGGLPAVTLAKGQDFETTRCGIWIKR